MTKPPAFQWYPKDWLTDVKVRAMSPAARGIYIDLLSIAWLEECKIPDDVTVLARLVGVPLEVFEPLWEEVRPCWRKERGALIQRRLHSELRAQRARRERSSAAGKYGASKRWGSKAKASPMPKDSSASASSPSSSSPPSEEPAATPQARLWEKFKARFREDQRSLGKGATQRKSHFINLARLVKQHSEDEVAGRIDGYFDSPPWKHRDGPRSMATFIKCFDDFAGTPGSNGSTHPSMDSESWTETEVPR